MKPRIGSSAAMTASQERRRWAAWTAVGTLVAGAGVGAAGLWALSLADGLNAAMLGPTLVAVASIALGLAIALAPFSGRHHPAAHNNRYSRSGTKEEPQ